MDVLVPAIALVIGASLLFMRRLKKSNSGSESCGGCSGCSRVGSKPASGPQIVHLKRK